jgi:hypothetical protein
MKQSHELQIFIQPAAPQGNMLVNLKIMKSWEPIYHVNRDVSM